MKTVITVCLLAAGATALAQSPASEEKMETARATKSEAEEAKTRKQLEEARARLDKAAREVAELSGKLGARARHEIRIVEGGPRRAVLGIQIDEDPGKQGVRILNVSPGGPAAEAGLRDKDIIIALDGEELPKADADRALVTRMRQVKPDQKVKVRVLRDGKRHDYVVVARPPADRLVFHGAGPEMGMAMGPAMSGVLSGGAEGPLVHHWRFWPGEFEGLELASITPKLGAYFGVNEGVLVVQAPKESAFQLEDGDVIQGIDGRKPDNGPHALRILRSYRSGEKLTLTVLRQRKPVTLSVTMPERPDLGDVMWQMPVPAPTMAPLPAIPAVPAVPGVRATPQVRPLSGGTVELAEAVVVE
jgi:predicted metalloprotease with PDZ domain